MTASVDVLVAGAGPAGIAAALQLVRGGLEVLVVDRARFPRDKPCAEYLSPGTLGELHALGVLPAVEAAGGVPLRGTTVFGPRGSQLAGLFALAGHRPFRDSGLSISRRILDDALVRAARVAGVQILEATAVEALLYDGGSVAGAVLRGAGGREVCRTRLVIGADGLRSVVARSLGGRRHGGLRRMALVAHLEGVSGLTQSAEMHVGNGEYVGLNPLGGGVTNVALVVPTAGMSEARGRAAAFLSERLRRFPGTADRLRQAGPAHTVQVTGPFAVRSRTLVANGAMLTGDAAEFFDPFTGEGICSALRGGRLAAAAAIEALHAGAPASAARLRPYLAARRQAFLGRWVVERLIGWALEAPALFDRAVRQLERHGLSHTLIGVTGDFVPPREILNLRVLAALVR